MSGVRFEQVTKVFGDVVALECLDLEIKEGEFVSLLGPSGSGKTTALNVLAGLLPHDGGEIYIGGRAVGDMSPSERNIAMVFQNYALYPHMSVYENLAFPLRARGRKLSDADIEAKVSAIARTLGIEALLDRLPRELSGGQQQRVAVGRGMVRDPSVFLLDEPLSNLDARLRIRMRQDIKSLHDRIGGTTVYVTHDQAEALAMSDRIAIFDRGRLQQIDPPNLIYARPVNMFVANFVGEREINFVRGNVQENGGTLKFHADGFEIEFDAARAHLSRRVSPEVILGIRPEAITAGPATSHGLLATVVQTEWAGPELIVIVELGATRLCGRAAAHHIVGRGDHVRLLIDPARLLFFDPKTEVALNKES